MGPGGRVILAGIAHTCAHTLAHSHVHMIISSPTCRDDLLASWIVLISQSPVIQALYESHSFLRDPELLQNLIDALQLTQSIAIRLEPLFIQGL